MNNGKQIELEDKETYGTRFETVRDFVEATASPANKKERYDTGPGWLGIGGGLRAVDKAVQQGWTEGMTRALEVKHRLTATAAQLPGARAIRRKRSFGAQGDELDPHKLNTGNLDKAWT